MRSLIKLSLASLAAVALFAGMASAQVAPKLSGDIGAGFGQFSYGETVKGTAAGKAFSEFATSWESNLRMTVDSDQLTAIVRYRARASIEGSGAGAGASASCTDAKNTNGDTLKCTTTGGGTGSKLNGGTAFQASTNDIYHEIWWKPAPNLSIGFGKFQGQAWSQPLSGTYIIVNPIEEIISGSSEFWMNWTGIAGLDIEYNAGVVQVGLAIATQCKPSCNTTPSEQAQSMVPHLTGKVGDIAFRAQLPQTSGVVNCSGTITKACTAADTQYSVSGSGLQAGVSWAGMPGLAVALDIAQFTDTMTKDQKATTTNADRARSSTALRVDYTGVTFAYFQFADNNFSKKKSPVTGAGGTGTGTLLTLRYTIAVGPGQIIPEYRSATADAAAGKAAGATKAEALTNSEIRLIGKVSY